jgi:hypothetical protein
VRRDVPAPSSRSTEGGGRGPGLINGALCGLAPLLVLVSLAFAASASAAPTLVMGSATNPGYDTVQIDGKVATSGSETEWFFEVSSDGGNNWDRTNLAGLITGPAHEVTVPESGEVEGLKPGTTYQVRLGAFDYNEFASYSSPEPYPEFTTKALAQPTVTIEPAGTPTPTKVRLSGHVTTNAPAGDPSAADVHWHFECSPECPGSVDEQTVPAASPGEVEVEFNAHDLVPDTEYEARLVARNAGDPVTTGPVTFKTAALPAPTASIDPVATFTSSTAQLSGHIDPNAPSGGDPQDSDVHWHFECTPECPGIGNDNVVPGGAGETAVGVEAKDLEPNTTYEVRLIAKNAGPQVEAGPVSFKTDAVPPLAQTLPAFALEGGTSAQVGAKIDPRNAETTYRIVYGPNTAYGQQVGPASAGSGNGVVFESEEIAGLEPSTTYHFKVIAESVGGTVEGRDMTFETDPIGGEPPQACPNETLRAANNSTHLPECRAYEQVSPVEKNGFDGGGGSKDEQPAYVAAASRSALAFVSAGSFADSVSASLNTRYLSTRTGSGWTTHSLSPLTNVTKNAQATTEVPVFTSELDHAVLDVPPAPSLAPGDTPGEINLYMRDTESGEYRTINLGGGLGIGGATVTGMSADHKVVFFHTAAALTPDATPGGFDFKNLYRWDDGALEFIARGEGRAVSADGSRAVFQDFGSPGHEGEQQLYLWDDGETTQITSSGATFFGAANEDLSRIFFKSEEVLTEDAEARGYKLYMYDSNSDEITLVTPPLLSSSGGAGAVIAVSADGSYVYFLATGEYLPGVGFDGGNDLYLWHEGQLSYIAEEADDHQIVGTARLSLSGTKLSFAATQRITAYDNTDLNAELNGHPVKDSEAYIYDADLDRLTCVSCRPTGERPENGTTVAAVPGPPIGTKNLQPGVRDSGPLFFNSKEALVPEDINGKTDVYAWNEGRIKLISAGTGGANSFLASSSDNGDDVYISTRDRLVPADRDENYDIYDARVDGGFAPAPAPPTCDGIESCHGPSSSAPPTSPPPTTSLGGERKLNPSAARLRKTLKACNKKPKKKRARCKARARKRFGANSTGRGH